MRNGAAFRTCQRMSSSRSRARSGTFSNRRSETLATLSGIASATRLGLMPIRSKTRRSAAPTAFGSAMFDGVQRRRHGAGGSGSIACAVTDNDDIARRHRRRRDAMSRNFDGDGRRSRREKGLIQQR